ncbi:MAG: preprotein translocase subunit SecG [Gemmatimonadaceae bacterium]|jgi:preprotein translocase subunit SecG|nr:preprotein translocase subunit SecG [Gemmatimonadaceae bacterium]
MFTFLLIILVIDALVLITAILLQAGKGTGLAASFGGASSSADSLIGTRQAGNLLTQITWWSASIFLSLAFVLQISSSRRAGAPKSVLDKPFSTVPTAPAPAPASGNAGTALPLSPATPAPTGGAATPAPSGGTTPAPAAPAPAPAKP